MIIGKLNQIHKDHKAWLSEIEFFKNEIKILSGRIQNEANDDTNRFQNDLDHHKRLLDKLQIAIKSHQAFLYELAHEDLDSLDMLDLEGHNRNKLHCQNLSESFKKLRTHINEQKVKGKLEIH